MTPHRAGLHGASDLHATPSEQSTIRSGVFKMLCTRTRRTRSRRVRQSLGASVMAIALVLAAQTAPAATFSWDAGDGFWTTAGNWSPAGPPGLGDIARIGNLAGIANDQVSLNQNDAVGELHVTDGMTFGNSNHTFSVIGDTFLSGLNVVPSGMGGTTYHYSRIFIRPTAAPVQFTTDNLVVTDEARVRLYEGGVVEVRDRLTVDSTSSVYGEGGIRFIDSGVVLSNSGTIDPAGGSMVFNVTGGGSIDLDGLGSGRVQLQWAGEQLAINGGTLTDAFSGEILIDGGARLDMNLGTSWTADASSEIRFGWNNNGISPGPAIFSGAPATLGGLVEAPYGTHGRIDAPTTFSDTAVVEVLETAELELTNTATVDGGVYTLGEDANLRFDGGTIMRDGIFNTHSLLSSEGAVRLNGPSMWSGQTTINGIAIVNGDASVTGATTIDAGVLDMDGGGSTQWGVFDSLVINAESIDSTISNTFDGGILVSGGIFSRLNVNLNGSFDHWTMNGEMILTNPLPFQTTRLGGSPMRMSGYLGVNGLVRSNAHVTLASNGATAFSNPDSSLALSNSSTVEAGATFSGGGELFNLASGELLLEDGANTDGSVVRNAGTLSVGDGAGGALVDDVVLEDSSVWRIEIGGHAAIAEHDHLMVLGDAVLDGLLEVHLIDLGSGVFLPEIGDEFTVLTSLLPYSGAFLNNPVSIAAGHQFHWDVVHDPNTVTLVLSEIIGAIPEPSGVAALLVALCAAATRTRR